MTIDRAALLEELYQEEFAKVLANTLRERPDDWASRSEADKANLIAIHRDQFMLRNEKVFDAIDQRDCSMLNNGTFDPRNLSWRRIFTRMTGIELPKGVKATNAAVRAWLGEERVAGWYSARQAKREAEEDARKLKRAAERLAEMEAIKASVVEGAGIDGRSLVDLARHVGIDIHPRTAGTAIKRLGSISSNQASVYGKGPLPQSVWRLYRDVCEAVRPVAMEAAS